VSAPPPTGAPAADAIACPRCAAPVGPAQDWCLACGAGARTRLVPTPNWHVPVAVLALVAVVAGVVLVLAFASLTSHREPAAPVNSQAAPPAADTGQPQATPAPPTTAAPPATSAPTTSAPTTTTAPGSSPGG
jgi:hypothetical protein